MTTKKDGGPAFPIYTPDMSVGDDAGPGMSLRDWFAGQALAGIASRQSFHAIEEAAARSAYAQADAMLVERSK